MVRRPYCITASISQPHAQSRPCPASPYHYKRFPCAHFPRCPCPLPPLQTAKDQLRRGMRKDSSGTRATVIATLCAVSRRPTATPATTRRLRHLRRHLRRHPQRSHHRHRHRRRRRQGLRAAEGTSVLPVPHTSLTSGSKRSASGSETTRLATIIDVFAVILICATR